MPLERIHVVSAEGTEGAHESLLCVDSTNMGIHTPFGLLGGDVAVGALVIQSFPPPSVTWTGFSPRGFASDVLCSTSTSMSSSSLVGVGGVGVPVGVGVGVVACFTYRRSCGSSPAPTSEQVFSNRAHPSATHQRPTCGPVIQYAQLK